MPSHEEFQAAICKNPDDDHVRLVYTDWLEEEGLSLSEFIRIEIELHGMEADDPARAALETRRNELSNQNDFWPELSKHGVTAVETERGFPKIITIPFGDFVKKAEYVSRVLLPFDGIRVRGNYYGSADDTCDGQWGVKCMERFKLIDLSRDERLENPFDQNDPNYYANVADLIVSTEMLIKVFGNYKGTENLRVIEFRNRDLSSPSFSIWNLLNLTSYIKIVEQLEVLDLRGTEVPNDLWNALLSQENNMSHGLRVSLENQRQAQTQQQNQQGGQQQGGGGPGIG